MTRPDFGRVQRQQRKITEFVGETATWQAYVSASAGTPVIGVGNAPQYAERTITALFARPTLEELQVPGGVVQAGDVYATMDKLPDGRDRIVWQGTAYHVAGTPQPLRIANGWRVLLRQGAPSA